MSDRAAFEEAIDECYRPFMFAGSLAHKGLIEGLKPLRLVYADYLEEIDEGGLARAQRWMAEKGVSPCPPISNITRWDWWPAPFTSPGALPVDVYRALPHYDGRYEQRELAEADLALALEDLAQLQEGTSNG